MQKKVLLVLATLPVAAAASCGGGNAQPPLIPSASALPTAPSATASAGPNADLSPVTAPASLVGTVHIAQPGQLVQMVKTWTGLPLDPQNLASEMLGNPKLAKIVDLSMPVDIAFAVEAKTKNPREHIAYAFGIKQNEDFRAALDKTYKLVESENRSFRLIRHSKKNQEEYYDRDRLSCSIAPAAGAAPIRLVCAERDDSLPLLLPYLTRGITTKTFQSAVHMEGRIDPVRPFARMIAQELLDDAGSKLRDSYLSSFADFVLDLDQGTLDFDLDDSGAKGTLDVTLKDKRSMISRALSSHADLAGPPPAAFLRLPGDADFATYLRGAEAADLPLLRDPFVAAIVQQFQDNGLPEADGKVVGDLLKRMTEPLSSPFAYARGVDVAAAAKVVDASKQSPQDTTKFKAAIEQLGGWDAIGVEIPAAKTQALLKDWVAFFGRKGWSTYVAARGNSTSPPTFTAGAVAKGLPAGTSHFEFMTHHISQDAPKPGTPTPKGGKQPGAFAMKLHVIVVPVDQRSFIVTSLDEATAVAKAKQIPAGESGIAAKIGDAGKKANAVVMSDIRGIGLKVPLAWSAREYPYLRTSPLGNMTTQTQGTNMTVLWLNEHAQTPAGFSFSVVIPKAGVTDLVTYGSHLF